MPSSFPQSQRTSKTLERKLEELATKKHLPEELVAIVSAVARLQEEAMENVRFEGMDEQALPEGICANILPADARAQGGIILAPENFPIDREAARALGASVMDVLKEKAPQLRPLHDELDAAFADDPELFMNACDAVRMAADASSSQDDPLTAWAEKHPEAPSFLRFVAQSAVMPSLTVAGRLLGEAHDAGSTWQHGHCPVCGSAPLMGRLAGSEGARTHVCSYCSFEYRVPRIGCTFCLTAKHGGSDYYASEDEPGYVLDVCGSCNNYIKLADFREYDRAWVPLLDDLASLSLDIYARRMGFTRPTLSAWGF